MTCFTHGGTHSCSSPTPDEWGRFMSKIRFEASGCWTWTGGLFANGYGAFSLRNESRRAHRVLYVWTNGELADGLQLDHTCRNKACVNPAHLEPVTHHVNQIRKGLKTHCIRGHEFTPENSRVVTFRGRPNGRACRECMAILRRESYRRLHDVRPEDYRRHR